MVLRSTRSGVLVLAACLLAGPAGGQTATAPIASVESRWDDVYCDLLEVSPRPDAQLQARYRYRNTGTSPLQFPTLKNFVAQTQLLDLTGRVVHGPLQDTGRKIVGSTTLNTHGAGLSVAPGASQVHWVRLPAPPGARDLALIVQGCTPFEGIVPGGDAGPVTPMTSPRPALASEEMQLEGMVLEVLDLRRTPGELVTLLVRYRNAGSKPYRFPVLKNMVAAAYLLDSKDRKKYEVVRDAKRQPIASTTQDLATGSGASIAPGETLTMWVKFPAPPETTTTMSLFVPDAPPVDDLEISGSGSGNAGAGADVAGTAVGLEAALKDLGAEVAGGEIRIAMAADVLFDFDRAELKPKAEPALRKVATVLQAHPDASVLIEGHTDSKGTAAYNQTLSEQRAAAVAAWLASHGGVASLEPEIKGWGSTKPIAHNAKPDGSDDPDGRAKNRRVEILVRK